MTSPAPAASSVAPATSFASRVLRGGLGVLVVLITMASVNDYGLQMGRDGVVWVALALVFSMLLLVASFLNARLLWNPMGKMLRWMFGERGARVSFGIIALTFALSAMYGAGAPPTNAGDEAAALPTAAVPK